MTRIYTVLSAMLVASAAAYAGAIPFAQSGQIQVGAYAGNTYTGADSGLTANYINGAGAVECVGQIFQGNTCATGSSTGWTKTNFDTSLFASVTPSGQPTLNAPNTYSKTSTTAGESMTDTGTEATSTDGAGGVTFAMINDGGTTANDWASTSNNTIMNIPVGIFGVTDIWTMLQNYAGTAGQQDTKVFFNFGTSSSAVTQTLEIDLTNANSSGTGGQIRSAVDCTTNSLAPTTNPAYNNCTTYAVGTLANSSTVDGITVLTDNVYTGAYTSVTSKSFQNTSGNIELDDQGFEFGTAYSQLFLVSVGVEETHDNTTTNVINPNLSLTALTGVTLDYTVPEPSTWMLVLGGFAAIGIGQFVRQRRDAAAKG